MVNLLEVADKVTAQTGVHIVVLVQVPGQMALPLESGLAEGTHVPSEALIKKYY